jgi:hypothetical protein
MKKLCMLLLIFPFIAFAQEVEERIMTMTEFKIKQGHTAQFKDGVKKYKECYTEDGGEEEWTFWSRMQGEGTVYGVTGFMDKWAEMDETDEAGKDCYSIVMNFIMPHVETITNNMARTLPDWSRKNQPSNQTKLAWVTYYKVDNGGKFSDVIEEVTKTMTDVEGDSRAYWYSLIGGDVDNADYMVSSVYSSYAELDIKKDTPYEMYVKAKGEDKAKEISDLWESAGVESWSYIWEIQPDLSK